MRRWGLSLPIDGILLREHETLIRKAEAAGYTDAWSQEVAGTDPFTPLSLASCWSNMRLGTAIAGVYTRGPAITAMHAAGMAEGAPGRFILGLGSASEPIVTGWNGVPFERPLERVAETVEAIRSALAGEKVVCTGKTISVRGFRLSRPVPAPVPIYVAALRKRMLETAAQVGDGVIINWLGAEDVKQVRSVIDRAAAEVGKQPKDVEVVCRIFVMVTDDPGKARSIARRHITGTLPVPTYRKFHDWLGRGRRLQPMNDAWSEGRRQDALDAIPDDLVDELFVIGTPEQCVEHISRYVENGVDTPVLAFTSIKDDPRSRAEDVLSVVERVVPG